MLNIQIKDGDLAEFVGQIIDTFEDFLADRGIELENDERDEARCEMTEEELEECELAIIYGTDYGELQTGIETILNNWSGHND